MNKRDAKPQTRSAPLTSLVKRQPIWRRRRQQVRASKTNESAQITGMMVMKDYSVRGRVSGHVLIQTGPQGGIAAGSPVLTISYAIRRALRPHTPSPPISIYDATGKLIATVDPVTRKRTEIA